MAAGAHATSAEWRLNLVRPEGCADHEWHGLRAIIFSLALGPHPQRELTLILRVGFPVLRSAWPQALMPPAPSGA
jgi:hypothetical protein